MNLISFKQVVSGILAALLSGAGAASAEPAAKQQEKPNIILFMVDDMGWQDTSVPFWTDDKGNPKPTFLNKRYRTPNMEKLAEQGVKFTHAYAQPICSPSRCSLMSCMNSARHRVTNWTLKKDKTTDANHKDILPPSWSVNGIQPAGTEPSGETTRPITEKPFSYSMSKPYTEITALPEILKKQGYTTIHCGKAHFGSRDTPGANPKLFGFDYNIAGTEIGGPGDYRGSKQYGTNDFHVCGLDENNYYENDTFLTEALTQEALKRIETIRTSPKESGKPFYLYMSHYAIHAPFDQRGYDKRFAETYGNPNDGKPWSDNEKRYSALIEGMDKSLGDIRTYLEQHDLAKNTIVIFMADNGGLAISGRLGNKLANYPLSFGKGSCREGGIREPMIVYWPGVTKAGTVNDTPVIIEDFFPSILEMAGVHNLNTVQKVDGKSFVPALQGRKMDTDRPLLFHSPNIWGEGSGNNNNYSPATAMRQGDWKLIYWHPDQRFELFNLASDISEEHNLATAEPKRVKAMAATMTKLLQERKAQMPTYKEGNGKGMPAGAAIPWPDESARKQFQ